MLYIDFEFNYDLDPSAKASELRLKFSNEELPIYVLRENSYSTNFSLVNGWKQNYVLSNISERNLLENLNMYNDMIERKFYQYKTIYE